MRKPLEIGGGIVRAGDRRVVDIPLSMMSDHTPATLSVLAVHGRRDGPTLFVSAAVHGDEVVGVEIVRRLARMTTLRSIAGTLLLIPIVNTFGFISQSRYLPDRRDLNRSFPGSPEGSLAARLAHLFLTEVIERSDFGIDLHSAAVHRINLPQIRVDLSDERARDLAKSFGPPIIIGSPLRPGSLRLAASKCNVPVMVLEAGEGLRFDEMSVRVGVNGVLRVMRHLGMISRASKPARQRITPVALSSSWLRAPEGGIFRTRNRVGQLVEKGELVGVISDPFGERETALHALKGGLIIGRGNLPVVNQGDALFHIAALSDDVATDTLLERMAPSQHDSELLYDEDELI